MFQIIYIYFKDKIIINNFSNFIFTSITLIIETEFERMNKAVSLTEVKSIYTS